MRNLATGGACRRDRRTGAAGISRTTSSPSRRCPSWLDLSNRFNRYNNRFRRHDRNRWFNNNNKIWLTAICVRVVRRNFSRAMKGKFRQPVGLFLPFCWLHFSRFFGLDCSSKKTCAFVRFVICELPNSTRVKFKN